MGAFETDLRTEIVYSDRSCADLHGVESVDPETGIPLDDFFDSILDEDRKWVRKSFDAAIWSGQSFDQSYCVRASGRKPRWIRSQGTVYRARHGALERLIGIVIDQTKQRAYTLMQDARVSFLERVPALNDRSGIACLSSKLTGEALFAHSVGIGTVDPAARTLQIADSWMLGDDGPPDGVHRFDTFGSSADDLREGRFVLIADVRGDARIVDPGELEARGIRAVALVPLMTDHRVVAIS